MKQVLFKVKENKLDTWRKWVQYLEQHEAAVLDTLKEENCVCEIATLFETDDTHYVYMAMEFAGKELPANPNIELNQKHREALHDCLEPIAKGETLYNFKLEL